MDFKCSIETQCNLFPFQKTENMLLTTVIETRIAMFPSRKDYIYTSYQGLSGQKLFDYIHVKPCI